MVIADLWWSVSILLG